MPQEQRFNCSVDALSCSSLRGLLKVLCRLRVYSLPSKIGFGALTGILLFTYLFAVKALKSEDFAFSSKYLFTTAIVN